MYALMALVLVMGSSAAEAQVKESTSLKIVPQNVEYYSASLRCQEQLDMFLGSNAYKRIMEMGPVQFATGMAKMQLQTNDDLARVVQFFESEPELTAVLKDLVSHEVFTYGSGGIGNWLEMLNELNRIQQTAQLEAMAAGEEPQEFMMRKVLAYAEQNKQKLVLADFVVGLKSSDVDALKAQLNRLDQLATGALGQDPNMKDRYKKQTINGHEYLTLTLEGSMVPWQMMPAEVTDALSGMMDHLKKMTLTISLGVHGDYLIVSIGDSTDHLAQIGTGSLLADASEMAPVLKAGDKKLTSIGYASASLLRQAGSAEGQLDTFTQLADLMLPQSPLSEDLQTEIRSDLDKAISKVKESLPEAAAMSSYGFITEKGFESLAYSWGGAGAMNASKPLPLLKHVGEAPIMFFVARTTTDPEQYEMTREVFKRAYYYAEKIAAEEMSEEEFATFQKAAKRLMPLMAKFDEATSKYMIPAMADGQAAMVLDAKSTSTQWTMVLPESAQPLPMLELGMIQGVSDREALEKGLKSYFDTLQEVINTLSKMSQEDDFMDLFPQPIPPIQLPAPATNEAGDAKLYSYAMPPQAPVSERIAPNMGINDKMMIMSLMPEFTTRLFKETQAEGTLLQDASRPLAAAFHFDFPALVDTIWPWVGYGMQVYGADAEMAQYMQMVEPGLEVAKCFKGVTGISYVEGDAMVTHTEWRFEDLK